MIEKKNSLSTSMDPEDLQKQVLDLRRQLAELRVKNRVMWTLLAEVSHRLQASSTSIKAAVSSLLDYDIFWDGSTQHEFLETIDVSVDQGANLITLMTLAFRSEASSLEMKPEPHLLQEILLTMSDNISMKMPGTRLKIDFPPEGAPVSVDYGYLTVALRLLLEVLIESEPDSSQIELLAVETENGWTLDIEGIQVSTKEIIGHLDHDRFDDWVLANDVSPENLLKLFTASQIFHLQNIQLDFQKDKVGKAGLRLIIPPAAVD